MYFFSLFIISRIPFCVGSDTRAHRGVLFYLFVLFCFFFFANFRGTRELTCC